MAGVFTMIDSQWDDFIREFDKNGNGVIEFEEFKNMMQNLHNNKRTSNNMLPQFKK